VILTKPKEPETVGGGHQNKETEEQHKGEDEEEEG
jgi:hypothetical protein